MHSDPFRSVRAPFFTNIKTRWIAWRRTRVGAPAKTALSAGTSHAQASHALAASIVVGLLTISAPTALAQDATWDGDTDTDWATGTNWNTNTVPGAGSTVIINNGALANQPRVNTNRTAAQTNVSSGILTLAATLTSPVTISGSGIVNAVWGGNVVGNVTVLNGGSLQLRDSISFGAPITLNGSGVGGNGALRNISGTNFVNGAITLGSATTIGSDAGILAVIGTIDNGGHLLTATGSGNMPFVGAISGAGGFTKEGGGQTDLNGTNTYQGTTTVSSGILILNGGSAIADTGRVVVNGGAFATFNDETFGSLEGTGGFVSVSIGDGTRRLTVGGNNLSTTYSGDLRDNGPTGRLALTKTGAGTLTLASNNTFGGGTTITAGTLQIGNGGTTGTLGLGTVTNDAALVFNRSNDFTVNNVIIGSGTLTKQGTGGVTLTGANSYAGATMINAGTLAVANATALGTTANGTTVADGATLAFSTTGTIAEAINFRGTGANGVGALNALASVNLDGNMVLEADGLVSVQNAQLIRFRGATFGALGNAVLTLNTLGNSSIFLNSALSGIGGLIKNGTGQAQLAGNNTFTGPVTINAGVLQVTGGSAILDSVAVTGVGSGRLSLDVSETIGSITGAGSIALFNNSILTTGGNNSNTTYSGQILSDGGLTKVGTGTLTLSGTNTYSGGTTVAAGTLLVTGSLTSLVTVNDTGTVGGSGTLGGGVVVNAGGRLAPGLSATTGILRAAAVTLNSGSTYQARLNGPTAGTGYDQLLATGNVALGGATLSLASSSPVVAGSVITLIQTSGTLSGTFDGLAEAATRVVGSTTYRIAYMSQAVTLTAIIPNLTRLQADAAFDLFAATGQAPGSGTFSGPGVSGGTFNPGGAVGVNTITFTPNTGSPVTFTLTVTESPSLVVTTTSDSSTNTDGQTSLREAIAYANSGNAGANPVITFNPTVFATAQTIQLTQGELGLSRNVTIAGPGADRLTVRGDWNGSTTSPSGSRIFHITGGVTVEISGLTLTNGSTAGSGGAVVNFGNTLTLRRCVIRESFATVGGGGVSSESLSGQPAALRVIECAVIGNVANFGGGIDCGWNSAASTLLVSQSLIAQNTSRQTNPSLSGGGISSAPNTSNTIVGSSIVGNTSAAPTGGGIFGPNNTTITIQNTLVVGNTAAGGASDLSGGTVTDKGGNLIGLPNGTTLGQLLRVDANGRPLAAPNGGPTPSVALVAGSPALDAGVNLTTLTTALSDGTTTSLTLGDTSGLYVGATIQIGAEQMTVVTVPSATTCTVTRGANGSSATAHAADAPVNYATDQRGQPRIRKGLLASANARVDIGAYEAAPSRLHIDQSVTGGDGSGDSWANAMPELRTATAMAQTDPNVSEIWVARGTYKPAVAGGDRAATFRLRNGLAIYGGFTSGQTQLSQRDSDPATNGTRLSGDLNGNDGANFANNGENSYHVTVGSNTNATAVLDGFTVSGGNANGSGNDVDGAGMLNFSGSPSLTNVTLSGNSASFGGGIFNGNSSSPTLTNVTLSGNSAIQGGGIFNFTGSSPTLTHVTLSGNSAANGGGVYNDFDCAPSLRNCILWGNSGGEIANEVGSASVSDSLVQGGYGGGTNILDADPQFVTPITAAAPTTTGNLRLRSTSPAVNAGNNLVTNPALPATDLDGAPRIVGGMVDLGAYELIAPPTLTTNALTVTTGGTLTDLAALTGAAPGGGVFTGTGVSVDGNGKYVFNATGLALGTQVTVNYTVNGPNGTSNQSSFTITVLETPSLTVTTTSDTSTNTDGQTSLREALAYAATLTGPQTITFSDGTGGTVNFTDAVPDTITLTGGQLTLASNVTIQGPGARKLAVSGNNASRVFRVNAGATVRISGLTVTRGRDGGDAGGAAS